MRILILITCLFAFTAGSFADLAHAAAPEIMCAHHETQANDTDQDCVDDQTQNQNDECDDCCCIHTHIHVLTDLFTDASTGALKDHTVLSLNQSFRSSDHSPLYRPPIA